MIGTDTEVALQAVKAERSRQELLKCEGRFEHTLADEDGYEDGLKLACILEEVAEVGKNLLAKAGKHNDGDPSVEALYKELSQVAALSVAWMEFLLVEIDYDESMEPHDAGEIEAAKHYREGRYQ